MSHASPRQSPRSARRSAASMRVVGRRLVCACAVLACVAFAGCTSRGQIDTDPLGLSTTGGINETPSGYGYQLPDE